MEVLRHMAHRLERTLISVAAVCALLMMLHVSLDLVNRFALGLPMQGTIEIVSAYYMVSLVFLPLAAIDSSRGHISADVFTNLMSPALKRASHRFVDLLIFLSMGLLVWFSAREAWLKTLDGEMWRSGEFLIPVWVSRWIVPVGAFGMFLSVTVRLLSGESRSAKH